MDAEVVEKLREAGRMWRRSGDRVRELGTLGAVVRKVANEAVRRPQDEGLVLLKTLAADFARLTELVSSGVEPVLPWILADVSMAVGPGDDASSQTILSAPQSHRVPFWTDYSLSQVALHEGREWRVPGGLSPKPYILRSLMPLLRLTESLATGADPSDALREVDVEFDKRNRHKKAFDSVGIDGDGELPVTWNLRRLAILRRARRLDLLV